MNDNERALPVCKKECNRDSCRTGLPPGEQYLETQQVCVEERRVAMTTIDDRWRERQ